jgi:hypothetical protein
MDQIKPEMKSNYFFVGENNHIVMTVSGDYDFDDFKTYLKIIHAKCEQEGIFKMLLNALDVEGIDIPTLERYFLGVEAADQLTYRVKLAVAWHREYINYFMETVAVNRGGNVGVFGSSEQALEWLLNGSQNSSAFRKTSI